MNIYIKTMTEDDDKEVVAQACMSIADIIKEYGYMAIEQCKLNFSAFILPIVHRILSDANETT
jgi:hypothetical protein